MPKIAFLWPEAEFRSLGLPEPNNYDVHFGRAGIRFEAESACQNADYIISPSGAGNIDIALLDMAPQTKLVQLTGAGYDNVDQHECARRGIPIAYMPGLNAPSVAQTMLQMALRLRRPLTLLTKGGGEEWMSAREDNINGRELSGRVGVIGYGHIGRAVASLFLSVGLEVVCAKHGDHQTAKVVSLPMREVIATSDILVVALPATETTKGLLDASLLRLIKDGSIFLNCGRGGIVEEPVVAKLIETGQLAGAGFDVFQEEPIPTGHPLMHLVSEYPKRVLLTAHVAGQTMDSKRRNFSIALDNVERVAQGKKPLHQLRTPKSE